MLKKSLIHIQTLYNKRAKNDENSSTLAQTLETHILTAFKGEHKFIFELLQNADDSAIGEEMLEVSFVLKKMPESGRYYLIFSHSGAHFSEQDVEKICDNGQQYFQEKSLDPRKIGYKGIGFKAVFSVADCVHVISGDYNFRFDQGYFLPLKEARSAYPWPIIPIPNNGDILPELNAFIKKDRVTFILQIRPEVNIEEEILFIKKNQRLLLFLKNIRYLELIENTEKTEMYIEQPNQYYKKFFINRTFWGGWRIKEFLFKIPESTHRFLQTLQDSECPQRLKAVTQTQITFAVQTNQEDKLFLSMNNPLFSYLPTQVNCGFAYVINGDFLLNTERTRLMDNPWNGFLLSLIGYAQLKFLAVLAQDPLYQNQLFTLLPSQTLLNLSVELEQAYLRGFEKAIKEIAFIPSLRIPERLLKIPEVVIDDTGFYQNFNDFDFNEGGLILNNQAGIHKFMELFNNKIKKFIRIADVLNDLPKFCKENNDLKTQHYILNFLSKYLESHVLDYRLQSILNEGKFLLSNQNELCAPCTLYLPTKALFEIPGMEKLQLIHPKLLEFTEVLRKIGVRQATRVEFIRHFVKQDILANKISIETVIPITHLVLSAMQHKELKEEDWEYLKKLPVKTKEGCLKPPYQCYLSNNYHPVLPLEEILIDVDVFVSMEYLQLTSEAEQWKVFFKKLGVKEDMAVHHYARMNVAKALAEKPFMKEYLEHIRLQGCNPSTFHDIENFVDVDFIQYASLPQFSSIFWKMLMESWPSIAKYTQGCCYNTNKYRYDIKTTYLQFCVSQFVKVPSHHQDIYFVRQIFMPALYSIVTDVFPVANIPLIDVSIAFFDFFGFKTKLTVADGLKILEDANQRGIKVLRQYANILKYLLELTKSEAEIDQLKSWQGQLLSQNNTLQPIKQLQYFNHPFIETPRYPQWLKELPGIQRETMKQIAQLFAIPSVGFELIHILTKEENPEYAAIVREKVLEKLPIMALMKAHDDNSEPKEVLGELLESFKALILISSNALSLQAADHIYPISAYLQENRLYFQRKYDHPLTKSHFCRMISFYFKLTPDAVRALETYLYLESLEDLQEFIQGQQLDFSQLPKIADAKLKGTSIENSSSIQSPLTERAIVQEDLLQFTDNGITSEASSTLSERLVKAKEQFRPSLDRQLEFSKINVALVRFEKAKFEEKPNFSSPVVNHSQALQNNAACPELSFKDTEALFYIDLRDSIEEQPSGLQKMSFEKIDGLNIGRLGEKIVYQKLELHYKAKYPDCQFQETVQGFILSGSYFNKKTASLEPLRLELIWVNKNPASSNDSSCGSDFMINKNGIVRYVEVKSSHSAQKGIFKITAHEWATMQTARELYRIFRVFNLGTENPNIIKIKDPFQQIQSGNILIKAYEIKL